MSRLIIIVASLFLSPQWRAHKRQVWLIDLQDLPWRARLGFAFAMLWGVGQTRTRLAGNTQVPRVSRVQGSLAGLVGLVAVLLATPLALNNYAWNIFPANPSDVQATQAPNNSEEGAVVTEEAKGSSTPSSDPQLLSPSDSQAAAGGEIPQVSASSATVEIPPAEGRAEQTKYIDFSEGRWTVTSSPSSGSLPIMSPGEDAALIEGIFRGGAPEATDEPYVFISLSQLEELVSGQPLGSESP